jgi:hypothetical protein
MSYEDQEIPPGYCLCGCGEVAPISRYAEAKRGYAKQQPKRYIRGHHRVRPFWSQVQQGSDDECWPWVGRRGDNGYGYYSTRAGHEPLAHREAYRRAHGPIPKGFHILHSCDNPWCCNPAHLSAGTQVDNLAQASERHRLRVNETHPQTKFSVEQIHEIRRRREAGEKTTTLAREFGTQPGYISRIARGLERRYA